MRSSGVYIGCFISFKDLQTNKYKLNISQICNIFIVLESERPYPSADLVIASLSIKKGFETRL